MASFASVAANKPVIEAGGHRMQKRKLDSSLSSTSSNTSSATGSRRVAAFLDPPTDMVMSSASPSPENVANMSLEAKQRAGAVDKMLPVKSLSADLANSAIGSHTVKKYLMQEHLEAQMRNMRTLQAHLGQLTQSIDKLQFALHHAKKNAALASNSSSKVSAQSDLIVWLEAF